MNIYLHTAEKLVQYLNLYERVKGVNFGDEERVVIGGITALTELLKEAEIPEEIKPGIEKIFYDLNEQQKNVIKGVL
ncbi:MAG: hypothetical protein KJ646_02245 [Nanoarchaeota archaeon]|nr:hypothetical protein [Nanoarchaeota archaeon]